MGRTGGTRRRGGSARIECHRTPQLRALMKIDCSNRVGERRIRRIR